MNKYNNPKWWDEEYDSGWDRVKSAFRRDWKQTKHDFGGNQPDLHQNAKDTIKQASGSQPVPSYDDLEPGYRFGYGAREHYGEKYSDWDNELEQQLRSDWESTNPSRKQTWMQDREAIRQGWDYDLEEDDEVATADR